MILAVFSVVGIVLYLLALRIFSESKSGDKENFSGRETVNEELNFIDLDDEVGDPPSLYVDDELMTPALVDWGAPDHAGGEVSDVDRHVINEVFLTETDEVVTFSLTTGAPLLAAEISYYPPGSTSADFNADLEAHIDCQTDGRCHLAHHDDSTDIALRLEDGISRGGFLGLYLEYPAADRSDGVLFRSIAWAVHLES